MLGIVNREIVLGIVNREIMLGIHNGDHAGYTQR